MMAFERTGAYLGLYHVMHGVLTPLKGIGPNHLRLDNLEGRVRSLGIQEVILATNATVEGQTTAHYITDRLKDCGVNVSRLAYGIPMGGEPDYLDDGPLSAPPKARRPF